MNSRFQVIFCAAILFTTNLYAQSYGDYRIVVDVTGNGGAHNSTIYFEDDTASWDPNAYTTYGWDGCCDANSFGVSPGYPQIFTQVVAPPAPPNNHRLSLNGLPHLFEPIDVPFGLIPQALAEYTFSFTELYTLPVGTTVELEDLAQNVTQDLLLDSTYVTWGAPSDDEDRFIIHINPATVTGFSNRKNESNIKVVSKAGMIEVTGLDALPVKSLRLFDMQGRILYNKPVYPNQGSEYFDISNLSHGVFVLSVQTTKGFSINRKVAF